MAADFFINNYQIMFLIFTLQFIFLHKLFTKFNFFVTKQFLIFWS